jgi:hypothetical protein
MVAAQDMTGVDDHRVIALPHAALRSVLKKYNQGARSPTPRSDSAPAAAMASSTSASSITSGGMKRTVLRPQDSRMRPL